MFCSTYSSLASFRDHEVDCKVAPCWYNDPVQNSPSRCYGTLASECNYTCYQGFEALGSRLCVASSERVPNCTGHGAIRDCRLAFNGGACKGCDPGSYKGGVNRAECSQVCRPIIQMNHNPCIHLKVILLYLQCGVGQYINISAASACLDCPAGKFANETGAVQCN
jgi:hypothetical protein